MRTRVWCTRVALACLAIACGDQPTEVVPEREIEMGQGPGIIALATSSSDDGRSITTDKDDYQPGDTVWFTGAGWPANDTLDIQLDDEPASHPPHTWWIPVLEDGTFRDSTYVVDVGDLGVTFTLTATSRATGRSLTVQFTDNQNPTLSQVEVYEVANCTSGTPTPLVPALNHAVCARVSVTAQGGAGDADFHFQWVNPLGTVVRVQQRFGPTGAVRTDTLPASSVTDAGAWTVRTCKGNTPNLSTIPCTGGNLTTNSIPRSFTVPAPGNAAPVLDPIGNKVVAEETQLAFTATATDDNPGPTFSLANPAMGTFPTGAQITAAGAFTWTPTEEQGPGTYRVNVVVTDAGTLSDEEEIQIIVTEVNLAPVLAAIGPKTIDEETELAFTATATDPDVPANTLTFSLQSGTDPVPLGAAINAATGAFTWTPTEAQGPGVYKFKVRVTDNGVDPANLFDEEEITVTVNEVNKPPVLGFIGAKSVDEGSPLSFTATATDPDIPANTLTFSIETSGNLDLATAAINSSTGAFTWTPADDNPTTTSSDNYTVKVVVTDDGQNPPNLSANEEITIKVYNVPPTISGITLDPNTAGYVYPITGQPKVMAAWTDPGVQDTHTCTYDIKDEVLSMVVSTGIACGSPMNVTAAGLYTVAVTVTDDDLGSDVETFPMGGALIVIYDPSAGFVTGGGWISSPPGACKYAACEYSTIGKATFGFVSKYVTQGKDKTPELTGNTEFQFHAGNLNFKSKSYEWLVVNGGSGRAQYKGEGTVNGAGAYGFILTAYDGSTDKFRIKIWDVSSGYTVYDNKMGEADTSNEATALGGGSIIIHVPKK